jgi:DNA-binding PadR family transcriptional regulator
MEEEKHIHKIEEKCCDEDGYHDTNDCCREKHVIRMSNDCCEGESHKKLIFKLPFGRKGIKDMKDFFMLKIVSDANGEGITGYDLGKLPDMTRGSVMRKLDELKDQGLLRSEEESDGKVKKKKYFVTDKGKEQYEKLWEVFQETFSFLGDEIPIENFEKSVMRKHIVRKRDPHHPGRIRLKHDLGKLESKEEVKDYLASLRHRLNIVQKRLKPRLERLQKAREALNDAIAKVEDLAEFSKEQVEKIVDEIRNTYKDVWEHHPV